jgi:hypothetical protein
MHKQLEAQGKKIGNVTQRGLLKLAATITILTLALFAFHKDHVMQHLVTWAIEHELNDGL